MQYTSGGADAGTVVQKAFIPTGQPFRSHLHASVVNPVGHVFFHTSLSDDACASITPRAACSAQRTPHIASCVSQLRCTAEVQRARRSDSMFFARLFGTPQVLGDLFAHGAVDHGSDAAAAADGLRRMAPEAMRARLVVCAARCPRRSCASVLSTCCGSAVRTASATVCIACGRGGAQGCRSTLGTLSTLSTLGTLSTLSTLRCRRDAEVLWVLWVLCVLCVL